MILKFGASLPASHIRQMKLMDKGQLRFIADGGQQ
jgi:hypothetical protein